MILNVLLFEALELLAFESSGSVDVLKAFYRALVNLKNTYGNEELDFLIEFEQMFLEIADSLDNSDDPEINIIVHSIIEFYCTTFEQKFMRKLS